MKAYLLDVRAIRCCTSLHVKSGLLCKINNKLVKKLIKGTPDMLKYVCLMVFNATFNNISVISWLSVLLVEDPEKTTDLSQVTDKLDHIMLHT